MNVYRASLRTLALLLAFGTASARAGSVTYEFIEQFDKNLHPVSGNVVGGILELASPPASSTSNWFILPTAEMFADILDFQILDPSIGIVGSYKSPQFGGGLGSSSMGQTLTFGAYGAYVAPGTFPVAFTIIPALDGLSSLGGMDANEENISQAYGTWKLAGASAVPEPSSLVMLGLGSLGLAGFVSRGRVSKRCLRSVRRYY